MTEQEIKQRIIETAKATLSQWTHDGREDDPMVRVGLATAREAIHIAKARMQAIGVLFAPGNVIDEILVQLGDLPPSEGVASEPRLTCVNVRELLDHAADMASESRRIIQDSVDGEYVTNESAIANVCRDLSTLAIHLRAANEALSNTQRTVPPVVRGHEQQEEKEKALARSDQGR